MRRPPLAHPFDDDKLKEECGIFGVIGVGDAANFVALGLHALQHRGQEAGGIVSHDPNSGFNSARRFGYVRDNFTKADVIATLPGQIGIGHVRYSTAGSKGATAIRDVQLAGAGIADRQDVADDRSVQHPGRDEAAQSQGTDEGRRFPVTMRCRHPQALAPRTTAVAAGHVG